MLLRLLRRVERRAFRLPPHGRLHEVVTMRRVVRSPWLWILLGLTLAFLPKVFFMVFFLVGYAYLMLGSAWFYRQKWLSTGEIHVWRYNLRHRWSVRALVGTLAALGAFASILALAAVISGFSSR